MIKINTGQFKMTMWLDDFDDEPDPFYIGLGKRLIIKQRFAYIPVKCNDKWIFWKKFTDIEVRESDGMHFEGVMHYRLFRFTEEEYMVWLLTLDKPIIDHVRELVLK